MADHISLSMFGEMFSKKIVEINVDKM